MKYAVGIICIFLINPIFAQTKDRRAELNVEGRINEVSVSPDERIWLVTALGSTYFSNSIDSNWHYGKSLADKKDLFNLDGPHLERISFFNKDTAIMTGYISADKSQMAKNGYYFTKDGGNTWRLMNYGGDSWIYAIHNDDKGNVWMGGLAKEIYYSNNFGQKWKTIKVPYKISDRTYSIWMNDQSNGVAASDNNEIVITKDNWKTVRYLNTPADQNKYEKNTDNYSDERISKIIMWKNYIVVKQNSFVYYSDTADVSWNLFSPRLVDFEIDKSSKKLFGISDSLRIISFSSPAEYKILNDRKLTDVPSDIKAIHNSLFLFNESYIMKADSSDVKRLSLYTYDKKISTPDIIREGTDCAWGFTGSQIYLASRRKNDWYRENTVDFNISDAKLLNDTMAILWDGIKNNYLYSLHDHTAKIYFPANPLLPFLQYPVKSFVISSGSRGCFHYISYTIKYRKKDNNTFESSGLEINNSYKKNKPVIFISNVNSDSLTQILSTINSDPAKIPELSDFKITESDKKNYKVLVNTLLQSKESYSFQQKKKINKEFYYSIPTVLDTIKSLSIKDILDQQEGITSTTSNWFSIQLINQNNDTINVARNFYASTMPWNFPWKVHYKDLNFNSYSIDFSKFIKSCIPDDFIDKQVFDNKFLIKEIADYLYNK
jgi:hypothetical protein